MAQIILVPVIGQGIGDQSKVWKEKEASHGLPFIPEIPHIIPPDN